jgi:hypothetical protein
MPGTTWNTRSPTAWPPAELLFLRPDPFISCHFNFLARPLVRGGILSLSAETLAPISSSARLSSSGLKETDGKPGGGDSGDDRKDQAVANRNKGGYGNTDDARAGLVGNGLDDAWEISAPRPPPDDVQKGGEKMAASSSPLPAPRGQRGSDN